MTVYRKPGREVERFQLLERIGSGGLAEVFLAEEIDTGRRVALKRLLEHLADNETFVDLFRDEAHIAAQLNHPNICRFIEAGEIPGIGRYIAMEHIDGADLATLLKAAAGPLKQGLAAYIVSEVCAGLEHAHRRTGPDGQSLEIVHRQVTPSNVMVSRAGDVKLIDFSTARARGRCTKTEPGVLKGQLGYMAPETIQGLDVDHRADIFGAGTLLYELLTGRRAFLGEGDFGTLQLNRRAQPADPRKVNPKISELLELAVLRALARDPGDRYQSAAELLWDLTEAIPNDKRVQQDRAAEMISRLMPARR